MLLFILSYVYLRFLSGQTGSVTIFQVICLCIVFFAFFASIFEGLLILNVRFFQKRIEFDETDLFITHKKTETIVPLKNIFSINMISSGQGSRGSFNNYEINYTGDTGKEAYVSLVVYWQKRALFEKFMSVVQESNPGVTIKRWTSSIEGIARFFKRKKQTA